MYVCMYVNLAVPQGMWDLSSLTGSIPQPLHWKVGILTTGPPGKSRQRHFLTISDSRSSAPTQGLSMAPQCLQGEPQDSPLRSVILPDRSHFSIASGIHYSLLSIFMLQSSGAAAHSLYMPILIEISSFKDSWKYLL